MECVCTCMRASVACVMVLATCCPTNTLGIGLCVCVCGQREADPGGAILWWCFAITCQSADMSPQRYRDGKREGLAASGADGRGFRGEWREDGWVKVMVLYSVKESREQTCTPGPASPSGPLVLWTQAVPHKGGQYNQQEEKGSGLTKWAANDSSPPNKII